MLRTVGKQLDPRRSACSLLHARAPYQELRFLHRSSIDLSARYQSDRDEQDNGGIEYDPLASFQARQRLRAQLRYGCDIESVRLDPVLEENRTALEARQLQPVPRNRSWSDVLMARTTAATLRRAQPARPMPEFRLRNRARAMARSKHLVLSSRDPSNNQSDPDPNRLGRASRPRPTRALWKKETLELEPEPEPEPEEVTARRASATSTKIAPIRLENSRAWNDPATSKSWSEAWSKSSLMKFILESSAREPRNEEEYGQVTRKIVKIREVSTTNLILRLLLAKASKHHRKGAESPPGKPPAVLSLGGKNAKLDRARAIADLLWAGDEKSLHSLLETDSIVLPWSVVAYLVQRASSTEDTELPGKLLELMAHSNKMEALGSESEFSSAFANLLWPLCDMCTKRDPRLLLKVAGLCVQHLNRLGKTGRHERQRYRDQRDFFNRALKLLASGALNGVSKLRPVPSSYLWAAQKAILTHSAEYSPPLQLDRGGFFAIRQVLAGLPKDSNEKHIALRHAVTWPPYLEASDGIDEGARPEDNWSRVVQAGGLMQEAGYAKDEADLALDVLQGTAPDGSPTIQQRKSGRVPDDLWSAAIRATRNAKEAWIEFQKPPVPGQRRTLLQYREMFRKLGLRDPGQHEDSLPGDKPLNYAVKMEANLSELEKARLQPPTTSELYEQMLAEGLSFDSPVTDSRKLSAVHDILVSLLSHSKSLAQAHRYLRDSAFINSGYQLLASGKAPELPADAAQLKQIGHVVLLHYVEVCAREPRGLRRDGLARLSRLLEAYGEVRPWVHRSVLWAPVLRELGQSHKGLDVTLTEQLAILVQVLNRLGGPESHELAIFNQFNKCLKKIARRELQRWLWKLEEGSPSSDMSGRNSLLELYATQSENTMSMSLVERESSAAHLVDEESDVDLVTSFRRVGRLTKHLFGRLAQREAQTQTILRARQQEDGLGSRIELEISAMDRMHERRDPVRADHAGHYMLALAYSGEFREMASYVRWLMKQWAEPDLLEEVGRLGEPPAWADFHEVLCMYRLLAEPMLEEGETSSIRKGLCDNELPWRWPDEDGLRLCAEGTLYDSVHTLRKAIRKVQVR